MRANVSQRTNAKWFFIGLIIFMGRIKKALHEQGGFLFFWGFGAFFGFFGGVDGGF